MALKDTAVIDVHPIPTYPGVSLVTVAGDDGQPTSITIGAIPEVGDHFWFDPVSSTLFDIAGRDVTINLERRPAAV